MAKKWLRLFHQELGLAIFIVVLPYLLFLHTYFDDNADVIYFLGLKYHHGFTGNDMLVWYILKKLIPITLLTVWFLTCRFRWKYFILASSFPFIFSFFYLFLVGKESDSNIYLQIMIPGLFSIVFLILLIYLKINFFSNGNSDILKINNLNHLFKIKSFGKITKKVDSILANSQKGTSSETHIGDLVYTKKIIEAHVMNDSICPIKTPMGLVIFEIIICIALIVNPIFFYLHNVVPDGLVTYNFLFITIEKNGFVDVSFLIYYLSHIICLLIPLSIWFITEQRWWRYAILSPIVLAAYQIWEGVILDSSFVDEIEYLKSFPFVVSLVLLLFILSYLIRIRYMILDKYDYLVILINNLVSTLNRMKVPRSSWQDDLEKIKVRLDSTKKEQSLDQLIKLKEDLLEAIGKIN